MNRPPSLARRRRRFMEGDCYFRSIDAAAPLKQVSPQCEAANVPLNTRAAQASKRHSLKVAHSTLPPSV